MYVHSHSTLRAIHTKTTPFTDYDVPITFGVCINTTTGIFIAPKSGTYFFSWREEHGDRSRLTFHSTNNLQINDVVSMQIYLPVDKWGCPVNANERAEFHPIYGLDAAKSFQLFAMV